MKTAAESMPAKAYGGKKWFHSPLSVLFSVVLANYLCEMIAWLVLSGHPSLFFPHSANTELIVEPVLLVVLLFPFLTLLVYRPLKRRIEERELAEEALKESEQQLQHLSTEILTAQEKERRRISRELHDEFGQALTLMKLQLRHISSSLREDQKEVKEECGDLLGYIDTTIENVRRVSRDLSPLVLEDLGLAAALKWLVNQFTGTCNVTVTADIEDIDNLFDQDTRIAVYRIVQEGLTNIGKHAGARKVSLSVVRSATGVSVALEDDGRGYEAGRRRVGRQGGFGLAMMAERVRMIGGTMDVTSAKNAGTRIVVSVPVRSGGG